MARHFSEVKVLFSHLSDQKVKAGVFTDPKIRQILSDSDFDVALSEKEITEWHSFKTVVFGFLGNHRYEFYVNIVNNYWLLIRTRVNVACH